MSDCCKSGFAWTGTPSGKETMLGPLRAYVSGTNSHAAVLIVADFFGWKLNNTRLLADHYAKEANVTVYLPDYFDGEVVTPDMLEDPEKQKAFDAQAFIARHSKQIRWPAIEESARAIQAKHENVGAIGYCYGAWAVLRLGAGANGSGIVKCVSIAHPSLIEKEEIDALAVPTQILAPEHDAVFTQDLKDYSNSKIPTLGIDYNYRHFPGVAHGFVNRADPENHQQRVALERAKDAAVSWFRQHLH